MNIFEEGLKGLSDNALAMLIKAAPTAADAAILSNLAAEVRKSEVTSVVGDFLLEEMDAFPFLQDGSNLEAVSALLVARREEVVHMLAPFMEEASAAPSYADATGAVIHTAKSAPLDENLEKVEAARTAFRTTEEKLAQEASMMGEPWLTAEGDDVYLDANMHPSMQELGDNPVVNATVHDRVRIDWVILMRDISLKFCPKKSLNQRYKALAIHLKSSPPALRNWCTDKGRPSPTFIPRILKMATEYGFNVRSRYFFKEEFHSDL